MTTQKTPRLKCRFCKATFARWKEVAPGKLIDGFDTVAVHMRTHHAEELAAINPEENEL